MREGGFVVDVGGSMEILLSPTSGNINEDECVPISMTSTKSLITKWPWKVMEHDFIEIQKNHSESKLK